MTVAPFPWLFEYSDDPVVGTDTRWGRAVLRPLVEVRVIGPVDDERAFALVDSGTEYTLIQRWIAQAIGIDGDHDQEIPLGIAGETLRVSPADVDFSFGPSTVGENQWARWSTTVGVVDHWKAQWPIVLGQRGFFDAFTVTMSRHAQMLAINERDRFDEQFLVTRAPSS